MNRETARAALARYFETPAARVLSTAGVTPNMLTAAGLAVAGAAAYLVTEKMLLAAGIVLLASGLFDMLDGAVARLSGRESPFGALLDSTADRVAEIGMFAALAILFVREGETIGGSALLCRHGRLGDR